MLRINQLAKELGVANQEVIEACEKRLGLQGKSHSSNLTDDQADQLRRAFQGKHKGENEAPPLALHKPSAAVRIVKAPGVPAPPPATPTPNPFTLSLPSSSCRWMAWIRIWPSVSLTPCRLTSGSRL